MDTKKKVIPGRAGAAVASVIVDDRPGSDGSLCTCCEPRNPLVMRPDFGTLPDGSAEYAICVLHDPEPMVYRNRGDGAYLQMPQLALNAAGELIDENGAVIARVSGDDFQRLDTLDDDDIPPRDDAPSGGGGDSSGGSEQERPNYASRPAAFHVDLSQDDFYGPR